MNFIINGPNDVFLEFFYLSEESKNKGLTWSSELKDERPATLKDLIKRLSKLYPLLNFENHTIVKNLIKSFVSIENLEQKSREIEENIHDLDNLIFKIRKGQILIDSNLKRLVWIILITFENDDSIFSDKINELSIFFHHLLASEKFYEGNNYSTNSADYVKNFYQINKPLLDRISFHPREPQAEKTHPPKEIENLLIKEMSTPYLVDMILTPASARGYQDPKFRASKEKSIYLLALSEAESDKITWLGQHQDISPLHKKYYIHPEAAEIHARNGINLRDCNKVEFLKTSSPRSFIYPSISEDYSLGIKVSLPRWFAGAIRLTTKKEIDISIMVDQFLKMLPPIEKKYRIDVWSDFAGCLPSQSVPFGMLFRKIKLSEAHEIIPVFSLSSLCLSIQDKLAILQSAFRRILFYAFEHGVIFESHAQNLLFSDTHNFFYRDNGGVFISPDLLKKQCGPEQAEKMIESTSSFKPILFDRLWRLFCGSCLYSTFCHIEMPREEIEKIYEIFFLTVKDDMKKYSNDIEKATTMNEACLILDQEYRYKYCSTSPLHRIEK